MGWELRIEVRNDGRGHRMNLLQGPIDTSLDVAFRNAPFQCLHLVAKTLDFARELIIGADRLVGAERLLQATEVTLDFRNRELPGRLPF